MDVYLLRDPRTQAVRWIGITRHPRDRFALHLRSARRAAERGGYLSDRDRWVLDLLAAGLLPVMELVERQPSEGAARSAEQHWIDEMRDAGVRLLNVRGVPEAMAALIERRNATRRANAGRGHGATVHRTDRSHQRRARSAGRT